MNAINRTRKRIDDWRLYTSLCLLTIAPLPVFARIGLSQSFVMLPYVLLGAAIGSALVVCHSRKRIALFLFIGIVTSVTVSYFVRAPSGSVYGYDSNITIAILKNAVKSGRIVPLSDGLRGSVKAENYPVIYSLLTSLIRISGIGVVFSVKMLPILLLGSLPLFGYLLSNNRTKTGVIAASLWMFPAWYLSHTGQAVPQLMAIPLFGLTFGLFQFLREQRSSQYQAAVVLGFTITVVSLFASHSLTGFVAIVASLMFLIDPFDNISSIEYVAAGLIVIMGLTTWIIFINEIVVVESVRSVAELIEGNAGVSSTSVLSPPNHVALPLLPVQKDPLRWIVWISRAPLIVLSGVFVLISVYKRERDNQFSNSFANRLFIAGCITFLLTIVGPVTTIRSWIFLSLVIVPVVTYRSKFRTSKDTINNLVYLALLVAVLLSVLVIPAATFTPNADSPSVSGRDLFPGDQVHASVKWSDSHTAENTQAVTGTLFFAWEERYRNPSSTERVCFRNPCENTIVFWHESFNMRWYSQDTGGYYKFSNENTTLSLRNKPYHSGEVSVYVHN